jgi:hypothetical protein
MTTKADYTADEWNLLMNAPGMAAMAVVAASPSGPIGVIKEMFAVGKGFQEAGGQGATNALISALVADVKAGSRPTLPAERPQGMQEVKDHALRALRDVSALLARKASPAEAEEFKRWLVAMARRAAEASKEGGVLGFGGVQVSDAEKAALTDVASALGIR